MADQRAAGTTVDRTPSEGASTGGPAARALPVEERVGGQVVDGPVTVTFLIDNASGRRGLRSQWGLSLLVETQAARVLLDCGATRAFLRNASELGLDLRTVSAFVLSHGHYDHGGDLEALEKALPEASLLMHPGALVPRYSLRKTGTPESIGLPERSLRAVRGDPGRIVWTVRATPAAPGVWVSGPVPRREALEDVEPSFHLDEACTVRDQVVDDQTVWIATASGLIVLFGCAHAGVINTISYIRRLAAGPLSVGASEHGTGADDPTGIAAAGVPSAPDGLPKVRAVLGGMHLLRAGRERREATAEYLAELGLGLCGPCHCTGKRATDLLRRTFPAAFAEVHTGSRFEFS